MEDTYLVEIRLARTKWRIREIIGSTAACLRLEPFMEPNPHITLFGPLVLGSGTSSQDLLDAIGKATRGSPPLSFLISGWELRRGMHGSVIAFSVVPSDTLREFTRTLAGTLGQISTSLNAWDNQPEAKWYHVTVANGLDDGIAQASFNRILANGRDTDCTGLWQQGPCRRLIESIRKMLGRADADEFPPVLFDGDGLRITVMQNQDILAEYDLMEDRWIYGDHSHDSRPWQETLKKFRLLKGFERTEPVPHKEDDIFFIADLHLGHANIIRYCSRPFIFSDCAEMDAVLIRNWNLTTRGDVPVYHIGDLSYGKSAPPASEYLKQLWGRAVFIAGNHDDPAAGWARDITITRGKRKFLLVHDPADAPAGFDGWIIHGHYHNNDLPKYPYMDFTSRRINVSAEVIGYHPVGIREIEARIQEHEDGLSNGPLLLRYPHVAPDPERTAGRQPAVSGSQSL